MKKIWALAFFLVTIVVLNALNETRMLGYQYDGVDGDWAILDARVGVVIDPNVTGYRTVNNYIVGLRVEPKNLDRLWKVSPEYGYFVFNMVTGDLEEGMCWHELVSNLSEKGVSINSLDRFIIDHL